MFIRAGTPNQHYGQSEVWKRPAFPYQKDEIPPKCPFRDPKPRNFVSPSEKYFIFVPLINQSQPLSAKLRGVWLFMGRHNRTYEETLRIAFLLLIVPYFAYANHRFRQRVRQFAHSKGRAAFLAALHLLPFLLLALPAANANMGGFLVDLGKMGLFIAIPTLATLFRPAKAKPLHPFDIAAFLAVWFPIEFGWLPEADILLAKGVALPGATLTGVVLFLLLFLVIRPLPNLGYTFRLTKDDFKKINLGLMAYTLIGIPIGLLTRFLVFNVADFDIFTWALALPLGYLFVALPEELLFRGIIQNQLHARIKNEWLALTLGAFIFGLAHLNNGTGGYPVPNWMYVAMATLAGLAYGWTWRKTGKITAAAVVHATVNFVWGIFLTA